MRRCAAARAAVYRRGLGRRGQGGGGPDGGDGRFPPGGPDMDELAYQETGGAGTEGGTISKSPRSRCSSSEAPTPSGAPRRPARVRRPLAASDPAERHDCPPRAPRGRTSPRARVAAQLLRSARLASLRSDACGRLRPRRTAGRVVHGRGCRYALPGAVPKSATSASAPTRYARRSSTAAYLGGSPSSASPTAT